jgi:hypothetical protein
MYDFLIADPTIGIIITIMVLRITWHSYQMTRHV